MDNDIKFLLEKYRKQFENTAGFKRRIDKRNDLDRKFNNDSQAVKKLIKEKRKIARMKKNLNEVIEQERKIYVETKLENDFGLDLSKNGQSEKVAKKSSNSNKKPDTAVSNDSKNEKTTISDDNKLKPKTTISGSKNIRNPFENYQTEKSDNSSNSVNNFPNSVDDSSTKK